MGYIPEYFNRLFKSVQTVESYFKKNYADLCKCPEKSTLLQSQFKDILIITPKTSTDFFSKWQEYKSQNVQFPTSLSENEHSSKLSNVLHDLAIFMLKDWKMNNAFVSGLKVTTKFCIQHISQKFERTVFDDIKNSEAWNILFSCIGEESFCRLLLDNIVLERMPNLAFCQLSGELVSTRLSLEAKEPKKQKKNTIDLNQTIFLSGIDSLANDLKNYPETKKRRLDNTDIKTAKIPRRIRKKMRKEKDINKKDMKKVCQTVKESQNSEHDVDRKREELDETNKQVDRSKIFLAHSIINSKTNKPLMALPKQHMFHPAHVRGIQYATHCAFIIFKNEFPSKRKGKAFLKRFNQIPPMIENIHRRHNKTYSFKILNRHCPIRDSAVDIIDKASTYKEVVQFVMQQLYKVFPSDFWGCKENFETIQKVMYHFISRQKKEPITLLEIMHKFKVKECRWLEPQSKSSSFVPSDLKRRENILRKMLNWLFCGYIIPVIKSMFYVTESTKNTKKMLYFRHDLWHELLHNTLSTTLSKDFYPLSEYEKLNLKIGCANIRFLPKGTGFRLITSLATTIKYVKGKYFNTSEVSASPKEILQPVLDVMKYYQRQSPDLMGSSVMGKTLFYERLKEYKQKQLNGSKLYFVKADIANCFDTIDQNKLLNVMESILKKTNYLNRRVSVVRPFCDKLIKKDITFSGCRDDMENLYDQYKKIKNVHRGSIVVDQNDYRILEDIIELLEESITLNAIKVGNRFYKRKTGIPQGSILSTMLCSFFLARFEKEKLSFLQKDPTGILFSYVDDFLYITKDINYARWFRNAMIHEIKRYGLEVNINKGITNIDQEVEEIAWLGYLINTNNLDVCLDLPKLDDIVSSVTTAFSGHPGEQLYVSCVRCIKLQFSPILMDSQFNCKKTLLRNLYENFFFAALKMETQATSLGKSIIPFANEDYLFDIVLQLSQYVLPLAPYNISPDEMLYLLFQAFFDAFVKKQSRYQKLTYCLKYMLDRYNKCTQSIYTLTRKEKKRREKKEEETSMSKKRKIKVEESDMSKKRTE